MNINLNVSFDEASGLFKQKTINEEFPSSEYYKQLYEKSQIVLHHTVSNGSTAKGDIAWWKSDKSRVATSMIITEDGINHQCFHPKYWAHALGLKRAYLKSKGFEDYLYRNKVLNQRAIQIEIDSLGPVNELGHSVAYGKKLRTKEIVEYSDKYRGYQFFERYTDEALETLYYGLKSLGKIYEIPLNYNSDMWDVHQEALDGCSGIWSHTSFRPDKSDCHPQKELIQVLEAL